MMVGIIDVEVSATRSGSFLASHRLPNGRVILAEGKSKTEASRGVLDTYLENFDRYFPGIKSNESK